MIPLRDVIPSRTTPVVTTTIIALNVLVFVYQWSLGSRDANEFVYTWGLVPADFRLVTMVTSMFLHGGFLHVGGNMLYMWIFGDNVEDRMGRGRFVAFYLACGFIAALTQMFVNPGSTVPMVGASGAVSGILGAYLLLFPYARILTLLTFGFFWRFVRLPAVVVLGLWILLQFLSVYLSLGSAGGEGGVAFFAHIGGFFAGIALLFVLRPRPSRRL